MDMVSLLWMVQEPFKEKGKRPTAGTWQSAQRSFPSKDKEKGKR